ncbi:uncharacterized protein LOC132048188 isoform X1 [Lycium ferocissimum]|uniref:uncharacterized protein LOC132048188 isoform X1 n=1 Tax=Lycium ferocissimum TaxID=112874 RepID=UPI00281645AC|nr:uncharacterized protein LOC132048188 isoform X1 [Lycium ferocissimum]XP_059295091.1 uncharacterized protein LOC132048188 isoform X1 [Lycium ferocissimum]
MEELQTILTEVFGDSSDSEGEEQQQFLHAHCAENRVNVKALSGSVFGESHSWEKISEINGLWLCKDFLSSDQQSMLLSSIHQEGWFAESSSNQAMRFGDLPGWAVELSSSIHEVIVSDNYVAESENCEKGKEACIFPQDLLWREPLFDQLIVNMYQPGEGICPHVDLMRFEDGIAIVSLESSCVMHFSRVKSETCKAQDPQQKVPVLLTPGCLILMWGEARYLWKHEINRKPGFQIWEGQEIDQNRRISVTLRKLGLTD